MKTQVNAGNYKQLKLQCYVCEYNGHIAIDCPEFKSTFEGNIKTYFEKTRLQSNLINIYPYPLEIELIKPLTTPSQVEMANMRSEQSTPSKND